MAELQRTFGEVAKVADPAEVVIAEICWAAGHVEWLRQRVADADPERLLSDANNPLLDAYNDERDRLVRMAAVALKAGVEERRVRLAEEQGRVVSELIRRILTGVGMDPTAPEVREVVHRELTLLAGAA